MWACPGSNVVVVRHTGKSFCIPLVTCVPGLPQPSLAKAKPHLVPADRRHDSPSWAPQDSLLSGEESRSGVSLRYQFCLCPQVPRGENTGQGTCWGVQQGSMKHRLCDPQNYLYLPPVLPRLYMGSQRVICVLSFDRLFQMGILLLGYGGGARTCSLALSPSFLTPSHQFHFLAVRTFTGGSQGSCRPHGRPGRVNSPSQVNQPGPDSYPGRLLF